jgi:cation diffusion facilitator CzcD-associated flavoprotein CzcO
VLEYVRLIRCVLQEEFEGEIVHAFQYTTAKEHTGKKVIVIGSATSGHDVAFDLASHGVGQ